jgi:hypothetical protein
MLTIFDTICLWIGRLVVAMGTVGFGALLLGFLWDICILGIALLYGRSSRVKPWFESLSAEVKTETEKEKSND